MTSPSQSQRDNKKKTSEQKAQEAEIKKMEMLKRILKENIGQHIPYKRHKKPVTVE